MSGWAWGPLLPGSGQQQAGGGGAPTYSRELSASVSTSASMTRARAFPRTLDASSTLVATIQRVATRARSLTATALVTLARLRRSGTADVRAIDRTYTQTVAFSLTASTTIVSAAFELPAGRLVVVIPQFGSSEGLSLTVSDTAGNTYVEAVQVAGGQSTRIFYAWTGLGHASNVVTATYGANRGSRIMRIAVYSGVDLDADPLIDTDQAAQTSSTTSHAFGSVTVPADTGALVIAAAETAGTGTWTPPAGYEEIGEGYVYWAEVIENAVPGTYSPTFTSSFSTYAYPVMAAFRARPRTVPRVLAATVLVGCFLLRVTARLRTLSASRAPAATLTRASQAALTATQATAATVERARVTLKTLTATALATTATIARSLGRSVTAASTLVATRIRSIALTRTASRATAATLLRSRDIARTLAAVQDVSGAVQRRVARLRTLAASSTLVATMERLLTTIPQELAATVSTAASLVRSVGRRLSASRTLAATRLRTVSLTRTATRTPVATITRARGLLRTLTTAVSTLVASVAPVRAALENLTATALATSATVARVPGRLLVASRTLVATRARSVGRVMRASSVTAPRVLRGLRRTIAATRSTLALVLRTQRRTLSASLAAIVASIATTLLELPNRLLGRVVIRPAAGGIARIRAAITARGRGPTIDPAVGGKPGVKPDE